MKLFRKKRMKKKKVLYMPIVLGAKYYFLEDNYKMLSSLPKCKMNCLLGTLLFWRKKATLQMKVMGTLRSACEVTGILNQVVTQGERVHNMFIICS